MTSVTCGPQTAPHKATARDRARAAGTRGLGATGLTLQRPAAPFQRGPGHQLTLARAYRNRPWNPNGEYSGNAPTPFELMVTPFRTYGGVVG